jgi:hypothetical protein
MSKGEKALFVMPAADLQLEQQNSSSKQQVGLAIPRLPDKCAQVEAAIELLDLVQVGLQLMKAVHLCICICVCMVQHGAAACAQCSPT